jgi:hypothetical protein
MSSSAFSSELSLEADVLIIGGGMAACWASLSAARSGAEVILPAVFLSFPARDPDFSRRHPNHATAEVVALVPARWFGPHTDTRWGKRGHDYEALKARLSLRLLEALLSELPQLRDKVVHH